MQLEVKGKITIDAAEIQKIITDLNTFKTYTQRSWRIRRNG